MSAAPVCVIGNLNIDLIVRGVVELPAWGRGVEALSQLMATAGQGGYLALALAHLGIPTRVIANVGDDVWGQQMLDELQAMGVDVAGIETTFGIETALTLAIARRHDGERAFIGIPAHQDCFETEQVYRHWGLVRSSAQLCVVGLTDLPLFSATGAASVLHDAHAEGITTILDSGNPRSWTAELRKELTDVLPDVDYLIINEHEARGLADETDVWTACRALQERSGHTVIVKCGEQGSIGNDGRRELDVPAHKITVADAVGAGDNFNAGFLLGLREGKDLEESMQLGTAVAAHYVARAEDRFASLADLKTERQR